MSGVAHVRPGRAPESWSVEVPGSKSLTNRALLIAGVAEGTSRLANTLLSDDTVVMREALTRLGVRLTGVDDELLVGGLGGPPNGSTSLYCGMGGTVGRFLLPMLATGSGRFEVDAHPQLRRRPLGPVLDALRAQGAVIHGSSFPLVLEAAGLSGGVINVDASMSSQFLSGLMLAAPLAQTPTTLHFRLGVSRSYLDLSAQVMRSFGAQLEMTEHTITVLPGRYRAEDYAVEPDASTASYFLAAAALTQSTVTLPGLSWGATEQGDIALAEHLAEMGAELLDGDEGLSLTGPMGSLRGIHVDMSDATDVFMTLACVAPFADSPTTIEGLANVRVKESDRLAATAENLRRLGISVEEGPDHLRIMPGRPLPGVRLPTFADHRIAMAFSLIGTRVAIELEDPRVVDKTCPTFWELWRHTGAEVQLWS